jgi:hypothetical protein
MHPSQHSSKSLLALSICILVIVDLHRKIYIQHLVVHHSGESEFFVYHCFWSILKMVTEAMPEVLQLSDFV